MNYFPEKTNSVFVNLNKKETGHFDEPIEVK